ncbi:MAG: hypothetical protein ACLFM8_06650 [Halobacteriales archaeon]
MVHEPSHDLRSPPTAAGLVLPLFALPALAALPLSFDGLVGDAIKWLILGAVLGTVIRGEGRSLSSIGADGPRVVDLGWAVAIAVLGV